MPAKSLQSLQTLCDPMFGSLTGSSVHGILQAGILAWVAMPTSRGSSQPRDGAQVIHLLHCQVDSLPSTIWEAQMLLYIYHFTYLP